MAPSTNPEPTNAPSMPPDNDDDTSNAPSMPPYNDDDTSNAPSTPPDNNDDTSNDLPMPGTGLWKNKEIGRDKLDDKVENAVNVGTKAAVRAKGGRRTGRR